MSENVDESTKVVKVLADVGMAVEKTLSDPGPILVKVAHLLPLAADIGTLAGLDYPKLVAEFKDLDAAEAATLLAELGSDLKLDNARLAAKVLEGLALAYEGEQYLSKVVAYAKSLKG